MFFTGQEWERKIQEKYPNFVTVLLKVILVFPFFYFWIWTYTQSCHFPSWIYCDSSFVPVITLTISFCWSRVCFLTTLQSVEIVIDYLPFRLAKIQKSDIFFKRKRKQNQVMLYIVRMQTVTLPMENLVVISRNTSYTCFYLAIHLYYSILKLFKPKRWKNIWIRLWIVVLYNCKTGNHPCVHLYKTCWINSDSFILWDTVKRTRHISVYYHTMIITTYPREAGDTNTNAHLLINFPNM